MGTALEALSCPLWPLPPPSGYDVLPDGVPKGAAIFLPDDSAMRDLLDDLYYLLGFGVRQRCHKSQPASGAGMGCAYDCSMPRLPLYKCAVAVVLQNATNAIMEVPPDVLLAALDTAAPKASALPVTQSAAASRALAGQQPSGGPLDMPACIHTLAYPNTPRPTHHSHRTHMYFTQLTSDVQHHFVRTSPAAAALRPALPLCSRGCRNARGAGGCWHHPHRF